MALLGNCSKQTREVIDFDIDYSTALSGRPDVIISAVAEVYPVGMSVASGVTGNVVKIIATGGTSGTVYKVTVLTTLDTTLVYEDEVNVFVEDV